MASYCNHHFNSKGPHFFKIILEDSEGMLEKKLLVPRRFVREYGREISDYVQVKDPSGRSWKLGWSKCDGEIWLKNGWDEFADFYSLSHGHLLVFGYEGKSQFSVVIMDKSATEIKYPIKRTKVGNNQCGKAQDVKEEDPDDEELEVQFFVDPTPSLPKKRMKSPVKCSPRPPKLLRRNSEKGFGGESTKKKCRGTKFGRKERSVMGDEKDKARKKAAAFKSNYPSFSCVVQPSYASSGIDKLHLPSRFCEKYINCIVEDETQAFLYSNRRRWEMTYHFEEKHSRARLSNGWKIFSKDNDLKSGDVCVFELIGETEVKFNVHIFRTDEQTSHCKSAGKQKQVVEGKDIRRKINKRHLSSRVYGDDESADRKYPLFQIKMKHSYLHHGYLHIPNNFVKDHIKKGRKTFILMAQNRLWDVIYGDAGRFYGGWSAFVIDNRLQGGDTCIFRLVGENVFKVDILRSF